MLAPFVLLLMPLLAPAEGASQDAPPVPATPASAPVAPTDYRIGPEDVLAISVWQNAELSRAVPVRPDGKISVPLVNDVQAAGLTPMELRESLIAKLREFMPTAEVSVVVTEMNSFKVSVIGEVKRSERYRLRGPATVLDVLAMAGGFQDWANRDAHRRAAAALRGRRHVRAHPVRIQEGHHPRRRDRELQGSAGRHHRGSIAMVKKRRRPPVAEPELPVWGILRRRWRWGALAALGCLVPAVSVIEFLPDVYRSKATVLIERQQIPDELVRSTVTSALETRLHTITQEILSRPHLEGLAAQFGVGKRVELAGVARGRDRARAAEHRRRARDLEGRPRLQLDRGRLHRRLQQPRPGEGGARGERPRAVLRREEPRDAQGGGGRDGRVPAGSARGDVAQAAGPGEGGERVQGAAHRPAPGAAAAPTSRRSSSSTCSSA